MVIKYGIATYDRWTGVMDCDYNGMHMDGTQGGSLGEFLTSAGQSGWEVCGCFPSGKKGENMAQPRTHKTHKVEDSAESTTFIFKQTS